MRKSFEGGWKVDRAVVPEPTDAPAPRRRGRRFWLFGKRRESAV